MYIVELTWVIRVTYERGFELPFSSTYNSSVHAYTNTHMYKNMCQFQETFLYLRISSSVSPPSDSMLDTLGLILGEIPSSSVEPP